MAGYAGRGARAVSAGRHGHATLFHPLQVEICGLRIPLANTPAASSHYQVNTLNYKMLPTFLVSVI